MLYTALFRPLATPMAKTSTTNLKYINIYRLLISLTKRTKTHRIHTYKTMTENNTGKKRIIYLYIYRAGLW